MNLWSKGQRGRGGRGGVQACKAVLKARRKSSFQAQKGALILTCLGAPSALTHELIRQVTASLLLSHGQGKGVNAFKTVLVIWYNYLPFKQERI